MTSKDWMKLDYRMAQLESRVAWLEAQLERQMPLGPQKPHGPPYVLSSMGAMWEAARRKWSPEIVKSFDEHFKKEDPKE